MNKKGFTLIELLAVIVILAIIALIAVPMILRVVENSRKSAALSSAYGYLDSVEKQIMTNALKNENEIPNETITVDALQNTYGVKVKGTLPDGDGEVEIEKGKIKRASLIINNYEIECNNGTCVVNGKISESYYKVNYNANGGTGKMSLTRVSNGEQRAVSNNSFTKEKSEFVKWNTKADGTGQDYAPGDMISPTSDVTLYAQWQKGKYTITFNAGTGATVSPASKQVEIDSAYGELPTPTRDDAEFAGWSETANSSTYVSASDVPSNSLTLYANWLRRIPTMTSATTPSGVASASSMLHEELAGWCAMSGYWNETTLAKYGNAGEWIKYGKWDSGSNSYPASGQWLQYQFEDDGIVPVRFKWRPDGNQGYTATYTAQIKASNDGTTWTDLTDVLTCQPATEISVEPTKNVQKYKYYRLVIYSRTDTWGSRVMILYFQAYGV